MKAVYVKPEVKVRAPRVKSYVICSSGKQDPTPVVPEQTNEVTIWNNQL